MTPRVITADEAQALLTAAPKGPYEACHPDDLPGRSIVMGGTEIRAPFDAFVVAIEDRERVSIANLLAAAPDLAHTVVAQAAEIERLRASLDRAHYALREWGPGCEHPGCNNLAPLRCEDCGARFCDDHDGGSAGHDSGVATPMPHAVGPDDLMAGVAMREAQVAR